MNEYKVRLADTSCKGILNSVADCIMLCGDFNGRIANQCDFIQGVDAATARSGQDTGRNSHIVIPCKKNPVNFVY